MPQNTSSGIGQKCWGRDRVMGRSNTGVEGWDIPKLN